MLAVRAIFVELTLLMKGAKVNKVNVGKLCQLGFWSFLPSHSLYRLDLTV